MDNQQGNVQSHPHWKGDTSYVRVPSSDGSFSIPARALNITWGNDPRYWEWIKLSETDAKLTGFEEAAILQQVNWLEITGKFDLHNASSTMTLSRSYKVYYVLKFNEDAFGWNHAAIKFKVKLHDDDEGILSQENAKPCEMEINLQPYREKPGLWHQIPVGEFKLRKAITALNVEVGMFEVETDWWKGSMILGGIKIKPNYC